jgi:hypothetical protein
MNAGATASAWDSQITMATPQVSTSGTAIDFTGIPAGVKRITVSLVGVSTNGTDSVILQLGDAGGIEATGYLGAAGTIATSVAAAGNNTTEFVIGPSGTAASVLHGTVTLTLENASSNTWTCSGVTAVSNTGTVVMVAGSKSTSAVLDRVRITSHGGSDTFDAGEINISYE